MTNLFNDIYAVAQTIWPITVYDIVEIYILAKSTIKVQKFHRILLRHAQAPIGPTHSSRVGFLHGQDKTFLTRHGAPAVSFESACHSGGCTGGGGHISDVTLACKDEVAATSSLYARVTSVKWRPPSVHL